MTTQASTIYFQGIIESLQQQMILRLPQEASDQLSSRGQVAINGTMNGYNLTSVVEPDGDWGHWLRIDDALRKNAHVQAGDEVRVMMVQTKVWPEPTVPTDFAIELAAAPEAVQRMWYEITPMARWEWVRWINATTVAKTRQRRIEVTISKMKSGKRRPCCFNRAACTDPLLSKNGKLLTP